MSSYMPKCATCEHFESCIIQKHLTEMALILWNISKAEDKADRKIEPQTEVETMSCAECKHRPIGAEICEEACHYEPQTDWHYDEQDATWYPYKHEDEPQQKSCATCKHALGNWDGESNNCGRCCGADRRFYEPKDEPQADCFLCKWLGEVDVCGRCRNRNLFAEADTEPQLETMIYPQVDGITPTLIRPTAEKSSTDCGWGEPKE